MTPAELAVQKGLTKAFIDRFPLTVVFTPRNRVRKPAGGYALEDGEPRDPQVVTLIEPGNIPLPVVTVDGEQDEVLFELLGEADLQVAEDDRFFHDGVKYTVVRLAHFNGWEQRALVVKAG